MLGRAHVRHEFCYEHFFRDDDDASEKKKDDEGSSLLPIEKEFESNSIKIEISKLERELGQLLCVIKHIASRVTKLNAHFNVSNDTNDDDKENNENASVHEPTIETPSSLKPRPPSLLFLSKTI